MNQKTVHLGASILDNDMKRIDAVMAMMKTQNKSEAVRFIIEAAWFRYGPEIEKKSAKTKNIQTEGLNSEILTYYYRTNFDKILERVNQKIEDGVVEMVLKGEI